MQPGSEFGRKNKHSTCKPDFCVSVLICHFTLMHMFSSRVTTGPGPLSNFFVSFTNVELHSEEAMLVTLGVVLNRLPGFTRML